MKAIETIIEWTPNRDPYLTYVTRGQVSVRTDDSGSNPLHPMSFGANTHAWIEATEEQRLEIMQWLVRTMIREDRIDSETVLEALSKIDEFAAATFDLSPGDRA